MPQALKSLSAFLLLLIVSSLGCSTNLPQYVPGKAQQQDGSPNHSGWAYGRFQLGVDFGEVEVRHELTGQRFSHSLHESGKFYWQLPGGPYEILQIWMGLYALHFEVGQGIRFRVIPGRSVYLGTLTYRSPTGNKIGGIDVLNEYVREQLYPQPVHQSFGTKDPPLQGLMYFLPPKESGAMFLDLIVNDQILEPFLLDTGATLTIITRQTAIALGIQDWWSFPRLKFLTSGGTIESPVTEIDSIQVGDYVLQDVKVAIDVDEHLPFSVLGMNFLQHFNVVLDPERQQVRLSP